MFNLSFKTFKASLLRNTLLRILRLLRTWRSWNLKTCRTTTFKRESRGAELLTTFNPRGTLLAISPVYYWYFSSAYHQVEGGHLRIFDASQLRSQIEARGFYHYHRHWAHALHSPFWWLKCMFWDSQEESLLIKLYHKLLVWDLMQRPWLTRSLEALLNPIMGKSIVMYFNKPKSAR